MPVLFKVLGFVYLASPRARWHTPMTNYLCIFADDKRTASKLSTGGKGFRYVSVYRIRGLVHTDSPCPSLPLSLSLSLSIILFSSPAISSRAYSFLFFLSFRIPNFIFIGRRFYARFVIQFSRNNGLPRGESNRKRIKSPAIPRYPFSPFSQLVTLRLRERYFERRI